MNKSIRKVVLVLPILVLLIGLFLLSGGVTFAKYVSNSIWDYYLKSRGFYFNSDYLGSTVVKNTDNLWNGESVHLNVRNNLNQNLIAGYDIGYTAVCNIVGDASTHAACHMNGEATNTKEGVLVASKGCINNKGTQVDVSTFNQETCEQGGYSWTDIIALQDLYFDVVLTDYGYNLIDVVVNVTVTSTYPYQKVLSGDFTLHKNSMVEDKVTMEYKNYTDHDNLIISNSYASNKCVKITWDASKLKINADSSAFSSYVTDLNGYINEIKTNIGAKSNLNFTFYKTDFDVNYDVSEFTLVEDSGC